MERDCNFLDWELLKNTKENDSGTKVPDDHRK